jgi:hypothetical protein
MKQTAVEWLLDQLENQVSDDGKQTMSLKVTGFLREQAKEIEKQQKGYSEEDMKEAYFSAIESTGEGWNGEYAEGNNPNIEEKFKEGFNEWFNKFKNK